MTWRVLGIFLSAQSDAGALTSPSSLVHGIYGFFAILMSSDKSEIPHNRTRGSELVELILGLTCYDTTTKYVVLILL